MVDFENLDRKPVFAAKDRMTQREWQEKRILELEQQIQEIETTVHPDLNQDPGKIEELRKLKQELAQLKADQTAGI